MFGLDTSARPVIESACPISLNPPEASSVVAAGGGSEAAARRLGRVTTRPAEERPSENRVRRGAELGNDSWPRGPARKGGASTLSGALASPTGRMVPSVLLPLPTHLSYTQLSTMRGCPRQWWLKYGENWPTSPQGALIAGRTIHTTLEVAENDGFARNLLMLVEHWQGGFEVECQEAGLDQIRWSGRKTKANPRGDDYTVWRDELGPTMLARFANLREADDAKGLRLYDNHSVELKIEVKLPDQTPLLFVLDVLLYVDADGQPLIRDYKTGQVGRADPTQAAVYYWGVRERFGWSPVFEMAYLRAKDDESRTQRLDIGYLADEVPAMFAWHQRQVAGGEYPPNPSDSWRCASCSVAQGCPVGQRLTPTALTTKEATA